ncbi:hypothetical protein CyaNS01_01134 [Cyanobium sp. NS01]|nr:hypothetical protein CyaNS01_01134 [Cyanobium sp. NS01]
MAGDPPGAWDRFNPDRQKRIRLDHVFGGVGPIGISNGLLFCSDD